MFIRLATGEVNLSQPTLAKEAINLFIPEATIH